MTDASPHSNRYRPLVGWRLVALLYDFFPILGIWFAIDLIWAVSYTFSPKKQPSTTK